MTHAERRNRGLRFRESVTKDDEFVFLPPASPIVYDSEYERRPSPSHSIPVRRSWLSTTKEEEVEDDSRNPL